ncbi:MAG: DUF5107 domain-containing protein [Actinomycetota bacterium]|nr:DUF5107 domain-containing protein [Actinomycetota bacterium]
MLDDEMGRQGANALTQAVASASRIDLPSIPADQTGMAVAAWVEPIIIDSYLPDEPDALPAFLEQRIYQGSSGRVYPLPFHERISQTKAPHSWNAVHLENEWLRVVILPELGGRIHVAYDKAADYDFVYRNNVIKPALVGLAGPWIAGGIEFNWPQHHRPATFLPVEFEIERESDGSVTVWCSDHDPFTRMKGMHGIRLTPGSSVMEARVRLHNRTETTQSFLWWANVAAAVNDDYQSFFPSDVQAVADHARRAVASFPAVDGRYYGVDYPARVTADRPDGDRLDWYRNIPVPTSYMVLSSEDDFFGGYDHGRDAGFVHWADHRMIPGKKQWTWGDAPFGWAWDRNLTDTDGPYVELMAGAFTNNQPDFSFLAPGETKAFSQYWYPIHAMGTVDQANLHCAVKLAARESTVELRVAFTSAIDTAEILVRHGGDVLSRWSGPVSPAAPVVVEVAGDLRVDELNVEVRSGDIELMSWTPRSPASVPGELDSAAQLDPATEPPAPSEVTSVDELFLIGQYLLQYRHATRMPEPYWLEALRRDPGDARSNTALGERAAWAGDLVSAERLLRAAIHRLTGRVPNPADGEALYLLGIVLVRQGRDGEARDHLTKACWNAAWRAAAGLALARLEARAGDLPSAIAHARSVVRRDADNLQARDLLATLLQNSGDTIESDGLLLETLRLDPLDQWALELADRSTSVDAGTLLDVALEFASCGLADRALLVLDRAVSAAASTAIGQVQLAPLLHFHRAWLLDSLRRGADAADARIAASNSDERHCLASRPNDLRVLLAAVDAEADCGLAHALLGSWYYDKREYDRATAQWTSALRCALPTRLAAVVERNLGIAAFNVHHDASIARAHYVAARQLDPDSAKLLYEFDQLAQRLGDDPRGRVKRLETEAELVDQRDDLTVVLAKLLTSLGRAGEAHQLLISRVFQPWEGGEGMVLGAWDESNLARSKSALDAGDPSLALTQLDSSFDTPVSLGEARHTLANAAQLRLQRGDIFAALGDGRAHEEWETAAAFTGDFLRMNSQPYSAQTYYSIVALRRLGRGEQAAQLARRLAEWAEELAKTPARIDFFATSLPSMLLFHSDPQQERDEEVATIRAQLARLGSALPTTAVN